MFEFIEGVGGGDVPQSSVGSGGVGQQSSVGRGGGGVGGVLTVQQSSVGRGGGGEGRVLSEEKGSVGRRRAGRGVQNCFPVGGACQQTYSCLAVICFEEVENTRIQLEQITQIGAVLTHYNHSKIPYGEKRLFFRAALIKPQELYTQSRPKNELLAGLGLAPAEGAEGGSFTFVDLGVDVVTEAQALRDLLRFLPKSKVTIATDNKKRLLQLLTNKTGTMWSRCGTRVDRVLDLREVVGRARPQLNTDNRDTEEIMRLVLGNIYSPPANNNCLELAQRLLAFITWLSRTDTMTSSNIIPEISLSNSDCGQFDSKYTLIRKPVYSTRCVGNCVINAFQCSSFDGRCVHRVVSFNTCKCRCVHSVAFRNRLKDISIRANNLCYFLASVCQPVEDYNVSVQISFLRSIHPEPLKWLHLQVKKSGENMGAMVSLYMTNDVAVEDMTEEELATLSGVGESTNGVTLQSTVMIQRKNVATEVEPAAVPTACRDSKTYVTPSEFKIEKAIDQPVVGPATVSCGFGDSPNTDTRQASLTDQNNSFAPVVEPAAESTAGVDSTKTDSLQSNVVMSQRDQTVVDPAVVATHVGESTISGIETSLSIQNNRAGTMIGPMDSCSAVSAVLPQSCHIVQNQSAEPVVELAAVNAIAESNAVDNSKGNRIEQKKTSASVIEPATVATPGGNSANTNSPQSELAVLDLPVPLVGPTDISTVDGQSTNRDTTQLNSAIQGKSSGADDAMTVESNASGHSTSLVTPQLNPSISQEEQKGKGGHNQKEKPKGKEVAKSSSKAKKRKSVGFEGFNGDWCTLCKANVSHENVKIQHFNGKRHQKNLLIAEDRNPPKKHKNNSIGNSSTGNQPGMGNKSIKNQLAIVNKTSGNSPENVGRNLERQRNAYYNYGYQQQNNNFGYAQQNNNFGYAHQNNNNYGYAQQNNNNFGYGQQNNNFYPLQRPWMYPNDYYWGPNRYFNQERTFFCSQTNVMYHSQQQQQRLQHQYREYHGGNW